MIKFRCKKKVRREKHGRGPSYTHREKKKKTSVNVYVELKGETYTVWRTNEEQKIDIDTGNQNRQKMSVRGR